jgi:hypothetical protein
MFHLVTSTIYVYVTDFLNTPLQTVFESASIQVFSFGVSDHDDVCVWLDPLACAVMRFERTSRHDQSTSTLSKQRLKVSLGQAGTDC